MEGRPVLVALNKIDLVAGLEVEVEQVSPLRAMRSGRNDNVVGGGIGNARVVRTSAVTGEGIAELRRAIVELAGANPPEQETALVTNLRQRQAITATLGAAGRAREAAAAELPHDVLLVDLYEALSALDGLTGTTTADDILRLIFSSFCIGK
jgi:tRNA modification GTPase